ncbi:ribosomal protein S6 kinase delta-1 isoform X2 [Microcaecilia unicolor]|nr:ribosomal protein S6 kinase delta-1 isoform X2 [Microcaecilia unicolor]
MASNQNSPSRGFGLCPSPEPSAKGINTLDHERSKPEAERESRNLFTGSLWQRLGKPYYLEKAGELIKLALKKEEDEDYEAAFSFYRKGVDLLLEGVQGESSPTRREAVKKKTAEYLIRAERISSLCRKTSMEDGSAGRPPGSLSSRPSWNLRSPAEELKAFRVLGVIGKVLLVLDTRNQQTFILKGLRKSSECSRSRKTIVPRCVPNMVFLHKYIISEESVFLLLQHAEGGKLWSYVSKFLNRSPDRSFEVPEKKRLNPTEVYVKQLIPSPKNSSSSSIESKDSIGGNMLKVLPLKNSLTPSSQDDSSTQEEEGRESPLQWIDSGSSSEEECTTSYLTLCNEYGQEKIEPDSLSEEPLVKLEGEDTDAKDLGTSVLDSERLSTQLTSQDLKFFTEETTLETISPTRISDSLSKSKNSPMEFFRIDSKDSGSELPGLDFGEKLYSLKSEPLKPLLPLPYHDSSESLEAAVDKVDFKSHDTVSRGSNDSVPVISFKDAAWDDVNTDEGRPDLLVNLPSISDQLEEGPPKLPVNDVEILENKLLETPDVLQLNHSLEQCKAQEENLNFVVQEPIHSISKESSNVSKGQINVTEEGIESLFTAFTPTSSEGMSQNDNAPFQGLKTGTVASTLNMEDTEESLLFAADHLSSAEKQSSVLNSVQNEELFVFTSQGEDFGKVDPTNVLLFKVQEEGQEAEGINGKILEGEKGVHQIFQDLDERLALASQFFIPEDCIQRWAAEIVVALDALHREGIVCRDLNPNNILLNDRGHIQLTYFSRWSEVEDSCDSDAMERMYCAPEIGGITKETEACDWWSLGAVLFELLSGKALADCHPAGINTHTSLNLPEYVSEEARSLIQQLLQFNPIERLGAGAAGVEDIKSHPFFAGVVWSEMMR